MMNKIIAASILALTGALAGPEAHAAPIAYHALVATDVSLNGHLYQNAILRIDLISDTSKVHPLPGSTTGFKNAFGSATVRIDTGSGTILARLKANQIAAVADIGNTFTVSPAIGPQPFPYAGFAVGNGFAFFVSEAGGQSGGHTTTFALGDIAATPADAALWSPATATLGTNLKTPTNLTGAVLACNTAPQPIESVLPDGISPSYPSFGCTNGYPVALATNLGPLLIYAPFVDLTLGAIPPYSLNWGVFWAEMPPSED
jgi:hypothetical protein